VVLLATEEVLQLDGVHFCDGGELIAEPKDFFKNPDIPFFISVMKNWHFSLRLP
jgi:hypothetical protein